MQSFVGLADVVCWLRGRAKLQNMCEPVLMTLKE